MEGRWPEMVDHIDGNGMNNAWANLREVDRGENQRNMRKMKSNTSGVTGVSFSNRDGVWRAHIWDNGKAKFLAQSTDFNEMVAVRRKAEIELNYHENHGKTRPAY